MNHRPTWEESFLKTALEIAKHSTCTRVQVGAVLVYENRILAIGYNGVAKGNIHCFEYFRDKYHNLSDDEFSAFIKTDEFRVEHGQFSEKNEIHGEANLLGYASQHGIITKGASLFCNVSPCMNCAKQIVASRLHEYIYINKYDRDIAGIDFLSKNGIVCRQTTEELK